MPLSIWVTRAASYAEVRSKRDEKALPDPDELIDREKVNRFLTIYDAVPHPPDHAWWIPRPKSREAWCSLFMVSHEGPLRHVELSASYSNPEFMRNMLDMFDLALDLARRVGARVFEETRGQEITAANIDAFLAHQGEFVRGQHAFFRSGQEEIQRRLRAPLELPLGAIDEVPDYLEFAIVTRGPAPTIPELCADTPSHLEPHMLERSVIFDDRESKTPIVRMIRFDGGVIVRPYWTKLPFPRIAAETLRAVDRVEERFGEVTRYRGLSCGREQRAELEKHMKGLGVEYYEWMSSSAWGAAPAPKPEEPVAPAPAPARAVAPAQSSNAPGELLAKASRNIPAWLQESIDNAPPPKTEVRLIASPDVTFKELSDSMGVCGLRPEGMRGPELSPGEPATAAWSDDTARVDYRFDPQTRLRTLLVRGSEAEYVGNDLVNEAYLSTVDALSALELLASTDVGEILLGLGAAEFLGVPGSAKDFVSPVAALVSHPSPPVAEAAARLQTLLATRMG
ncbi:Hypothetical protein A7982_08205 [Minicystis rosea]|nr:Hypothetical protein A7982_08205 [Minicystis rosea]